MEEFDDEARFVTRLEADFRRRGYLVVDGSLFVLLILIYALAWVVEVLSGKNIISNLTIVVMLFFVAIGFQEIYRHVSKMRRSKLHILFPFKDATFPCPMCEGEVSILQDWICGWCGGNWKGENDFIFAPCPASSCEQLPNAVRCPHCEQDVVVRGQSYEIEQGKGQPSIAGVARIIIDNPGTRKKRTSDPFDELREEWD